jgi:hypothetical protein
MCSGRLVRRADPRRPRDNEEDRPLAEGARSYRSSARPERASLARERTRSHLPRRDSAVRCFGDAADDRWPELPIYDLAAGRRWRPTLAAPCGCFTSRPTAATSRSLWTASPTSCWLLVVDVDEQWIAPYEEWRPSSRLLRSALARLNLGPRGREWLVPAKVLNEHARVIDAGDFSNPAFAARYRT